MNLNIAYITSNNKVLFRTVGKNTLPNLFKQADIETISELDLDILFYEGNESDNTLQQVISDESKFYPVRAASNYSLTPDIFEQMDSNELLTLACKIKDNWQLQNNLSLLTEIFSVTKHLKDLFQKDRTAFMEELWFILRNNLGTKNLKFVYNDLQAPSKEGQRNKLAKFTITGVRYPEPQNGTELEEQIMENYKKSLGNIFEICEYSQENSSFVATSLIKSSPLIILGNINSFSPLQKALMMALFDGFQA